MSVTIIENGDMLTAGHDAIVIPVNAVGVPGKGLALAAAKKWPSWARAYKRACAHEELAAGHIWVPTFSFSPPNTPRYIIAAATKDHWRNPSTIDWVEQALCALRAWEFNHHVRDLGLPALGCGLGGLAWSEVLPRIQAILSQADCKVVVYAPHEAPRTR